MEGVQLKYGQISGGENGFPITVAANQTFYSVGSKFVKRTGASTATVTLATATDSEILGHLEIEDITTVSTDGTEVRKCVSDPTARFRIPIYGGTFANYMKGKKCDIVISSGHQGAALNSATYGQLIIVDGDATNNKWVDVEVNHAIATKAPVV